MVTTHTGPLDGEAIARKRTALKRLTDLCRRFAMDRQGIGAIEFAIIAPVLLMLYIGALELTMGLSVAKRASRATGTIADIITQQSSPILKTAPQGSTVVSLDTMPNVAAAILAPYGATGLTLKISGITIDASSNATISWSWAQDGTTPYAKGSAVAVPTDLGQAGTFLVRSELTIPYKMFSFGPDFLPASYNQISISRQYYYRLRTGSDLACTGC